MLGEALRLPGALLAGPAGPEINRRPPYERVPLMFGTAVLEFTSSLLTRGGLST
jgi:hypothetical protein